MENLRTNQLIRDASLHSFHCVFRADAREKFVWAFMTVNTIAGVY